MTQPPEQRPDGFPSPGSQPSQPGPYEPPSVPSGQQPGGFFPPGQQPQANPYGAAPAGYPYGQQPGGPSSLPPTRKKKKTGLIIGITAAIIVILIVVGGGFGWPGFFTNKNNNASDPVLGDLRTIDPCSLINSASYQGNPATQGANVSGYPGFDWAICEINLSYGGDGNIYVEADTGLTTKLQSLNQNQWSITKQGDLTIAKQTNTQNQNQCTEDIFTSSGAVVTISASPSSYLQTQVNLCALTDIGLNDALTAIQQGKVSHLSYPADSLGNLAACSLLSASDVSSALPGINTNPDSFVGDHNCFWGPTGTNDGTHPTLAVAAGLWASKNKPQGLDLANYFGGKVSGNDQQISGHDTITLTATAPASQSQPNTINACIFLTVGQQRPNGLGTAPDSHQSLWEVMTIKIDGPDSSDTYCQAAKSLASKVWPQLPSSS